MRQLVAVFSPRKPGFHTATLLREVYGYLPVIQWSIFIQRRGQSKRDHQSWRQHRDNVTPHCDRKTIGLLGFVFCESLLYCQPLVRSKQTCKVLEFVHRMKLVLDVKHSIKIFLTHALGNTTHLTQMKNVTLTKIYEPTC